MAYTTRTKNGTTLHVPIQGQEPRWGEKLSKTVLWLLDNTFDIAGGTRTLTAELNVGTTYGIKSPYFKSTSTNISDTGVLRFARADSVVWRNNANNADIALAVDTSNRLTFNGSIIQTAATLAISLNDVSDVSITSVASGEVLWYSGGWVNGTLSEAGIASSSTLSAHTSDSTIHFTAASLSSSYAPLSHTHTLGDLTGGSPLPLYPGNNISLLTNDAGYFTTGGHTASRALETDGSGAVVVSAITSTELGYLDNASSNLQTQLDSKLALTAVNTRTPTGSPLQYTLVLGDANDALLIAPTGSPEQPADVVVPPNSSTAFVVGTQVVIIQTGTTPFTILAGSGVLVNSRNGLNLAGQYAVATLIKTDTNTWYAAGDLTA